MSRRKNDDYVSQLYNDFNNNPARNRKTMYERMYIRVLTEICTNRFTWTGLPDEIDRRFLELELFRHALVVFFWDDEFDRYFALRGSGAGKWNMYDNPVTFRVIGNTMISRTLNAGHTFKDIIVDGETEQVRVDPQCVPIWANTLRTPDWDIVYLQCTKLADIERTIEITLKAMRMPFMIAVDDNKRLSLVNIMRQHDEGLPVIYGTEAMMQTLDEQIKLLDLGIDREMLLNLQIAKSKVWNETMTLLGINNANQEKRERLVSDEVSANDDQVMAVRSSAMGARQYAAEQISERYDVEVTVDWNETVPMTEGTDTKVQTPYGQIGVSADGG